MSDIAAALRAKHVAKYPTPFIARFTGVDPLQGHCVACIKPGSKDEDGDYSFAEWPCDVIKALDSASSPRVISEGLKWEGEMDEGQISAPGRDNIWSIIGFPFFTDGETYRLTTAKHFGHGSAAEMMELAERLENTMHDLIQMDRPPLKWEDVERMSTAYGSGQTGIDWKLFNTGVYWGIYIGAGREEITVAGSRDEGKRIVQMLEDVRNGSLFTTVMVQRDYLEELEAEKNSGKALRAIASGDEETLRYLYDTDAEVHALMYVGKQLLERVEE